MKRNILILATNNQKKAKELAALVPSLEVRTLADAKIDIDVVEDGDTFAANAMKKVHGVEEAVKASILAPNVLAILADDSGICVDALDGGPGIRSARFAIDHDAGKGDADNNLLMLKMLADIPAEKRGAHFFCAIAMKRLDNGKEYRTEGKVEGNIAFDERGSGGFGYDPLFIPDAYPDRRTAELSPSEKQAISHRGIAMRAMVEFIGVD